MLGNFTNRLVEDKESDKLKEYNNIVWNLFMKTNSRTLVFALENVLSTSTVNFIVLFDHVRLYH